MNMTYPFFVWLLTIAIGPFLWFMNNSTLENIRDWSGMFEALPIFWGMGMVFSIPFFVIFVLAYYSLNALHIPHFWLKISMSILGIAGIYVSLKLIDKSLLNDFFWCFTPPLVISGLIVKIRSGKEKDVMQD
ncbi:MAG: hypothetical protein WC044_11415 [Crocinitomicaceae bacterium]